MRRCSTDSARATPLEGKPDYRQEASIQCRTRRNVRYEHNHYQLIPIGDTSQHGVRRWCAVRSFGCILVHETARTRRACGGHGFDRLRRGALSKWIADARKRRGKKSVTKSCYAMTPMSQFAYGCDARVRPLLSPLSKETDEQGGVFCIISRLVKSVTQDFRAALAALRLAACRAIS